MCIRDSLEDEADDQRAEDAADDGREEKELDGPLVLLWDAELLHWFLLSNYL